MAKLTTDELLDAFKEMTLLELSEFVKQFEDAFGVTAAASRAGGRHRDRGGRLDVEGLLELLHELRELDQRHLLERVKKVTAAELRHGSCPSSCFPWSPRRPAF